MADITCTAAQVGNAFPGRSDVFDGILTEAVTAGEPVYQLSTGKYGRADANAAGKQQVRGIALKTGAANQAVPIMRRGYLTGYTLSGMNYDAKAYLSDTVGSLADAAGTMTVPVGRVAALTDSSLTKVLYVDIDWLTTWA